MANAVFIHKPDSIYDDDPSVRYDFPKMYLSRVERTIGDWIVYYEPRSADGGKGRLAYFATARIQHIVPRNDIEERYFALVEPGTYLGFDLSVPRSIGPLVFEPSLDRGGGRLLSGGVANSAVRILPRESFAQILERAFTTDPTLLGLDQDPETVDGYQPGLQDEHAEFVWDDVERPIISRLTHKPFRAAAFARQVKTAYQNQCAMSGLSLTNGGGRPEVEAAHIKPVAHGGPDSVRNGLALSHTLHWMFDRGLISVADDHLILISHNKVPKGTVDRLIVPGMQLLLPRDKRLHPHPEFLRYHREEIYGRN